MNKGHIKLYLKILLSFLFVSLIFGYAFYQSRNLVAGPVITINEPENGTTTTLQLLKISGVAKNVKKITLNDRVIDIDEAGNFSERLLLSEGYNILKISGWDKFDKKTEKIIELVYKENVAAPDDMPDGNHDEQVGGGL